jgi:hypothetical protein
MGSLRITAFGGIKPKAMRNSQGPTSASVANDIKLWHGTAEPWRYPEKQIETGKTALCSIFAYKCCWLGSENPCANYTIGDVECPRIFSTGVMQWPAYATLENCNAVDCQSGDCCGTFVEPTWCRLGVPKPQTKPTLVGGIVTPGGDPCTSCEGNKQNSMESRAYFYTFVNEYGEESAHSPISDIKDIDTDSSVTLGFSIPPVTDGYCNPVSIRIYRAGSSVKDSGSWEGVTSDFFLVDEIDFQTGNFTHLEDTPPDMIAEPYVECHNSPPPEGLENITNLKNGVLVGSVGNKLWFSEPWKFHAWNCFMNLDDCIKAIAVSGDNIYVATNGSPYIVSINNTEENCRCCRSIVRVEESAPILCKRSMVSTPTGVIWASDVGLVRMTGNQVQIDTHSFMAEDDWQEWFPHDLQGVYYKGSYFGFNAQRGFIWHMLTGMYSEEFLGENARLSTLSLTPTAVHRTDQNGLYMVFNGDIYKWDSANTFMPYRWRTKLHTEGGLQNYSAAKVVFEKYLRTLKSPHPVVFRLYADDKLMFARNVICGKPFRLPKGYDALNWEIEIESVEQVNEIHLATSMSELTALNNS